MACATLHHNKDVQHVVDQPLRHCYRTLGAGVAVPTIALSSTSVSEDAAIGAVVGALSVSNGSGVYTFTITADPDSKFAIDGSNLETSATLDHEAGTSHSVTIQADNGVDTPINRTFSISVTNVPEQPALIALSLDDTEIPVDVPATINILGATSGSTITGSVPDGMTLNSGARTITGTPTTIGEYTFNLVETLADSPNSPRTTPVTLDVVSAGVTTFTVLDSDGNSFAAPFGVRDSDGNSFTVPRAVLDSDGNSFNVLAA